MGEIVVPDTDANAKYVLSEGMVLCQKSPRDPNIYIYHDDSGWEVYNGPATSRDWYEGTPVTPEKAAQLTGGNLESE